MLVHCLLQRGVDLLLVLHPRAVAAGLVALRLRPKGLPPVDLGLQVHLQEAEVRLPLRQLGAPQLAPSVAGGSSALAKAQMLEREGRLHGPTVLQELLVQRPRGRQQLGALMNVSARAAGSRSPRLPLFVPPAPMSPELGRAKFTGPLLNIPSSSARRLGSTWLASSARTVAHSMEIACTCAGASSRKSPACDARSSSRLIVRHLVRGKRVASACPDVYALKLRLLACWVQPASFGGLGLPHSLAPPCSRPGASGA